MNRVWEFKNRGLIKRV